MNHCGSTYAYGYHRDRNEQHIEQIGHNQKSVSQRKARDEPEEIGWGPCAGQAARP